MVDPDPILKGVITSGISPCFLYSSDNLDALNHQLWSDIVHHGRPLEFGGPGEKVKHAQHIHATVQVYGDALSRLMEGDMPHGWWYRGPAVREYMRQFDDPANWDKYEYTYGQRLQQYKVVNPYFSRPWWRRAWNWMMASSVPVEIEVNQLDYMRDMLQWSIESGVSNQRIVAITYRPGEDPYKEDEPCLQVAKASLLQGNECSLEACFRSHDYGNGWAANAAFLTSGFNRNVIEPAGGVLKEFILDSMSAQLYRGDESMVYDEIGWPQ